MGHSTFLVVEEGTAARWSCRRFGHLLVSELVKESLMTDGVKDNSGKTKHPHHIVILL